MTLFMTRAWIVHNFGGQQSVLGSPLWLVDNVWIYTGGEYIFMFFTVLVLLHCFVLYVFEEVNQASLHSLTVYSPFFLLLFSYYGRNSWTSGEHYEYADRLNHICIPFPWIFKVGWAGIYMTLFSFVLNGLFTSFIFTKTKESILGMLL